MKRSQHRMKERMIFESLIDVCDAATGDDALCSALVRLTRSAGFDCYAYFHVHPTDSYAVSNYPLEWQERYFSRGYMKIDPVVAAAKRATHVFRWSIDAERPISSSTQLRHFYTEAADFDLKSGLSVSVSAGVGRVAIVTFASACHTMPDDCLLGETAALGTTAAAYVHARIAQRNRTQQERRAIILTSNEAACLRWAAEGKSMLEIAKILGMKYGTVRFHLDSAKVKLGTVKLCQATAAAARLLLI
jgi:LuxR family transcriptional regulator, activator of conjugal transfer of Ti plasmids